MKLEGTLLSNEQLADVTILVGQQTFHAQRAILSVRSAVFAAMFQSRMQESTLNQITIVDIEPEVFEQVLKFIYTDKVEGLAKMARDLLASADKYALDHLKNMCEDQLIGTITKETVLQTLALADLYRAQKLKDKAILFICANIKSMKTADWTEFCIANPELAAAIISKMALN
ncbi:hypothetical protein pipiens_002542 [Culex pipiens pipiens]|uniref:BTB domain-containing protein n=1 Tax=Culex pipiens pipiens TaxID=38569 RepID=A0ABD1DCA2_CULPP